jgi:hypothetical protein
MGARVVLLLVLLCLGCQGGKIPCPKFKKAKSSRAMRHQSSYELTARAETPQQKLQSRNGRSASAKEIQHVDIEEWDCPKPGSRKYMPKAIKQNIKRNLQVVTADSTATRQ